MIQIILDTDIGMDCDDAGALLILLRLMEAQKCELLAITHCTSNPYGAMAINAIDRYYGHDLHPELIESGLAAELAPLGIKVPREHFQSNADFDFSGFSVRFDFALAQSLFSHLPFNDIRLCLERLAPRMRPGGRFYATFFALPADQPLAQAFQQAGGPKTLPHQDPYHYYPRDMEYACHGLPWSCAYLGDVGHPRGQHALLFVKL